MINYVLIIVIVIYEYLHKYKHMYKVGLLICSLIYFVRFILGTLLLVVSSI